MDATSEAGTGCTFGASDVIIMTSYQMCSVLWTILCCFYLFFFFFFTIIYFYSWLPANNAHWSSRFNQRSLFYNTGLHAQGQTCNLYNNNHHIFINHHTYPLYFGHCILSVLQFTCWLPLQQTFINGDI